MAPDTVPVQRLSTHAVQLTISTGNDGRLMSHGPGSPARPMAQYSIATTGDDAQLMCCSLLGQIDGEPEVPSSYWTSEIHSIYAVCVCNCLTEEAAIDKSLKG